MIHVFQLSFAYFVTPPSRPRVMICASSCDIPSRLRSLSAISKNHFHPGGMAASEWMRPARAVRDTLVVDYAMPGVNTTRRIPYPTQIAGSLVLLALSVSNFKQTLWHCGQL